MKVGRGGRGGRCVELGLVEGIVGSSVDGNVGLTVVCGSVKGTVDIEVVEGIEVFIGNVIECGGFGLTVVGVGKGVTVGRGGRVGRWVGLVEGKVGLTVSGIVGTTGCSVFGNVVELVEGTVGISVIGAVGV